MYTQEDIQEAKQILRDSGFFVDNLWHVDDVYAQAEYAHVDKDEIYDDEAMEILSNVIHNEWIVEKIHEELQKQIQNYYD